MLYKYLIEKVGLPLQNSLCGCENLFSVIAMKLYCAKPLMLKVVVAQEKTYLEGG